MRQNQWSIFAVQVPGFRPLSFYSLGSSCGACRGLWSGCWHLANCNASGLVGPKMRGRLRKDDGIFVHVWAWRISAKTHWPCWYLRQPRGELGSFPPSNNHCGPSPGRSPLGFQVLVPGLGWLPSLKPDEHRELLPNLPVEVFFLILLASIPFWWLKMIKWLVLMIKSY